MNRRRFLTTTSLATAAFLTSARAAAPDWPIGAFNRPWTKYGIDATLDGIKEAGFHYVGLLTNSVKDPLNGADASPDYLEALKKKIADRGLKANMGAMRLRFDMPRAEVIDLVHRQINNSKLLGLEYILTFGADRPQEYEHFYDLMRDAAPYAQERGIKLVMKPHGGGSGSSEEILTAIKKVAHPNFKIWYDAGNIIYYTGKDPLTELEPIIEHVTGFCAKDCAKPKGDVMIQLGEGKVDFEKVFARLKKAGFNGPIMLEGSNPGMTAEEATANARKNREFLEKTLAAI
jgi:sugar phosphate isomerase/epimerase